MSEFEKIVLIRTLLSFAEEVQKGKPAPGPYAIQTRLRQYTETTAQLLSMQRN